MASMGLSLVHVSPPGSWYEPSTVPTLSQPNHCKTTLSGPGGGPGGPGANKVLKMGLRCFISFPILLTFSYKGVGAPVDNQRDLPKGL